MTGATGIGSLPGADATEYHEAVRMVFGELPDYPHLPELPGRGAPADLTGRALAMMSGLGADLQPAGWRLTDASGIDHRRARSLLAQDLDDVEEQGQDFEGPFKVQVAGPWTLAATVERPRGDRVLADHGARRELAQALAEGIGEHVADVRRRLANASVVVQVDEPLLPAVLAATVPTASGFGRHRGVDAAGASPALEWVFAAVEAAGARPVAHCCAAEAPVGLLTGAGARGISVDVTTLALPAYDALAEAAEQGCDLLLGVVPSRRPSAAPTETALTERVLRLLDMLGIDPSEAADRLVVTPTCGLAGADAGWAREAIRLTAAVARNLAP